MKHLSLIQRKVLQNNTELCWGQKRKKYFTPLKNKDSKQKTLIGTVIANKSL
jgi:hypothetical protein